MTKACIKCKKEKPIEDYPIRSNGNRRGECRACTAKQARDYRAANKDKLRVQEAMRNYGLTEEQVLERHSVERCEICGTKFKKSKNRHIDHCHYTNTVRGTLCCHCNRGLGAFTDSIAKLRSAIRYLEHFPKPAIGCGVVKNGKIATNHMMDL